MRAALRAYPTLLRVGFAEAVAYRAETIVWMLTNTMPLVNLALWTAVSRGGPVGPYRSADLVEYFLLTLAVRQMTGAWVMWEMSRDIRMGLLSMRLLRPLHPLLAYSAENLSGIPLRAGFALPIAAIGLMYTGGHPLSRDPVVWLMVAPTLIGAWLVTFASMAIIGALSFYMEQAVAVFELWLAAFFTISGYAFPLDFLAARAPRLTAVAKLLPFYLINGFPAELLLGRISRHEGMTLLGVEWLYVVGLFTVLLALWRAGLRRYNAFGA